MSPAEYATCCAALKARWPSSRNYAGAADLFLEFANLPALAMNSAIDQMFNQGHRGPTLGEIKVLTAEIASARQLIDPATTSCEVVGKHGALAVLPEGEDAPPGKRRVICSACKSEWVRSADKARTVGEIAAGIMPPTDRGAVRDITERAQQ